MAYSLGAVKPHVEAAANEIGPKFGISSVGGWRATGSVPNSDHPKGLALDFMTYTKGDEIAAYAIANKDRLGVKYVIWNRRIWQDGQWTPYDGPSPHIDHVHISFLASGGSGEIITDPVAYPGEDVLDAFGKAAERLQDPKFWQRVGIYALGAMLILFGIRMLLQRPLTEAAKTAVNVVGVGKVKKVVS